MIYKNYLRYIWEYINKYYKFFLVVNYEANFFNYIQIF